MEYKPEWEREDTESGETENSRTSKEIGKIMNSVYRNIQFTTETPQEFEGGMLPTLDFAMWIQEEKEKNGEIQIRGKVRYKFYEKKVSSKFCIMEKGAMLENIKR